MKKRGIAVCSLVFALVGSAYGQTAASPTKVGVINIQAALIGTRDGRAAAKALEEKVSPKKKQIEALQTEITGLRDKYAKMSSVGSDEEKRKLQSDIDAKTKIFNRDVQDWQQDMDEEQNKVLAELFGKMHAVLDKFAKDNGYAVIIDVSQQNTPVLYAASTAEVTQEVVALYDKNVPAATSGAATPGAATPGATPGAATPGNTVAPRTTPAKPGVPATKPGTAK